MTLRSAQEAGVLVTLVRKFDDDEYDCVVISVSEKYILVADIAGFRFDGFSVFRTEDVTRVRHNKYDKFRHRVMKDECRSPEPLNGGYPEIDSLEPVFQYLEKTGSYCILLRETDREWWSNHCAVLGVKGETVETLGFDGAGTWEKRIRILPFSEISRIRFGSDYLKHYERYSPRKG